MIFFCSLAPQQQFTAAPAATQSQQALQQDPNDPTKWHVVQVATAMPSASAAPVAQAGQATAQIVTANGTVMATIPANAGLTSTTDSSTIENQVGNGTNANANGQSQTKTRLRRVACTCPNCKDGDRGRK